MTESRMKSAMRSRRIFVRGICALLAAVVACRGDNNRAVTDSASNANTAGSMRVALLTPGPITDQSWNAGAYAGLMAIRDSLHAQVSHIQTRTPAEFDENFRQYGTQGFDLVIGHGFEYEDAAMRIAPQFPKTVYVVVSGRVTAANVAGVGFAFEEASYQAGVVAGMMTKSGTIGMIGGQEMPPVKASFTAFERGAKSVNPNVRVLRSYIGNWEDVSAAKEQALTQIGRGADIIFQNADAAGLGIFQAAREKKVLTFGSNVDQNHVAPDVIIGSVVIDLPKVFLRIARDVQSRQFKGHVYEFSARDDVVRLTFNPALASRIPPAAVAASDSLGKAIHAGTFHTLDDILTGSDTAKPIGR